MGQRIRLTEGDLHRIVKESVKKVINESRYSSEVENELSNIYQAAQRLVNILGDTQGDGYEPDMEAGYDDSSYLYKWADSVMVNADKWLHTV